MAVANTNNINNSPSLKYIRTFKGYQFRIVSPSRILVCCRPSSTNWSHFEGCPIHPTRVDSSLVFAIRQTGNLFSEPYSIESTRIVSPSVDSTCRKSICARLRKYSWSYMDAHFWSSSRKISPYIFKIDLAAKSIWFFNPDIWNKPAKVVNNWNRQPNDQRFFPQKSYHGLLTSSPFGLRV